MVYGGMHSSCSDIMGWNDTSLSLQMEYNLFYASWNGDHPNNQF